MQWRGQCSRIRILRFFFKIQKTRFLRFLEMTCQKDVGNVIKVSEESLSNRYLTLRALKQQTKKISEKRKHCARWL